MPTGLTLGQLRAEIIADTGQSALVLGTAQANQLINFALERIQSNHDWKGLQAVTDLSYTAATDGLALPASFIAEYGVWHVDGSNADGGLKMHPIPLIDRRVWLERGTATQVAAQFPRPSLTGFYYYVWNATIWIVPRPTVTITARVHYLQRLNELVADSDTNFFTINYPGLMKWACLCETFSFLHDMERAQFAEGVFTRYLYGIIATDRAARWRQGAQQGMGGSPLGGQIGPSVKETI
jgi:hypothetical protein